MSAATDHQDRVRNLQHQADLAESLAPAFRDKFDFSESKHFAQWADMAFTAAAALATKQEAELALLEAQFEEQKLKELKAHQLAAAAESERFAKESTGALPAWTAASERMTATEVAARREAANG